MKHNTAPSCFNNRSYRKTFAGIWRGLLWIVIAVGSDVSGDDESGVTSSGDHVTIKFKMGEIQVKLELEKNKNVPQLTSYYTAENGRLIQWTLDQEQVKTNYQVLGTCNLVVIN